MLVMLRWVVEDDDGTRRVAGKPTAMDCIEFANEILKNEDELAMTMNDSRATLMLNVVRLLVPNIS